MKQCIRTAIVAALVLMVGVVFAVKQKDGNPESGERKILKIEDQATTKTAQQTQFKARLPRLVDLGADKCIPCRMMAPILEEMKKEFAGRLDVEFIDVWKNPQAGEKFGIKLIPTQIFYDPSGKELFRHEGFFSREDILNKWKSLGFPLGKAGGQTP